MKLSATMLRALRGVATCGPLSARGTRDALVRRGLITDNGTRASVTEEGGRVLAEHNLKDAEAILYGERETDAKRLMDNVAIQCGLSGVYSVAKYTRDMDTLKLLGLIRTRWDNTVSLHHIEITPFGATFYTAHSK